MTKPKNAIISHCRNCGRGVAAIPELHLLSLEDGETSHNGEVTCECGARIKLKKLEGDQEAEITFGYLPADPAERQ